MREKLQRTFFHRHLEDDEILRDVVHRHWLLGLRGLLWPTAAFVLCAALLALSRRTWLSAGSGVLAVVALVWWVRNFLDYYLDAWIVTDQGIIDVAWHGWFHRQSSRVLYSDIQGVSYEIQGFLGTLLRFGTVSIEKISTGSLISLEQVGNPRRVEGMILRNMEAYMHSKNLKDAKAVQEILSAIVTDQMQLRSLARPS